MGWKLSNVHKIAGGFRKNIRTIDKIFVLNGLMNYIVNGN